MFLYVIFGLLLAYGQGRRIDLPKCGVVIDAINYKKEVLKEINEGPYQLAIDYDTQTLFFSYTNMGIEETEIFRSAYFNLKDKKFGKIEGISGGFANTVDHSAHKVYLGGNDGLYEFDFNTKKANNLHVTEHNIWQLYNGNDGVYFTTYPSEKLYKYKGGTVNIVPELADTRALFAGVDKNENIYFSNSSGLYFYDNSEKNVVYIGNYHPNCFTKDIQGKMYFSTPDGIYLIAQKRFVKVIVEIEGLYGFVIGSNDNIIYANQKSIIELVPTDSKCYNIIENKIEDS